MKLKAGTGYFIFSKLLKMDHIIGNSKKGELLASLGADVEVFEAAVVIIMLPSFAIFMIGAAIVLYILVGYPGLIGLSFILLEMFLLHQLNNFIMQAKSEAGEYTD